MLKTATTTLLSYLLIFSNLIAQSSVEPNEITIARDSFGVPHIYAPTNAGVAYGLAWATAEDDFKTVQEQLLTIRGRLAEVNGASAAPIDIAVQWMQLDQAVKEQYPNALSAEFRRSLEAYCQGVNQYAKLHPKEVLKADLFPVYPQDIIKGYMLALALLTGVDGGLTQVLNNQLGPESPKGSNAFAISRSRTSDDKTYLAINSHQPLEGLYSWYEAHLISDEGLNILGATFPGGMSIFLGANEYLGWAHTVNGPDLYDIFKLEMHPSRKRTYRYDGEWRKLEKYKAKAKVKFGPFKIPVSKTYYLSPYGLTLENKEGYYSLRYVANQDIRAAEQWYHMNLATNWESFREALKINAITGTNIVYADREDNIFYVSNAKMPLRDPQYDWSGVVRGDTSSTLWGTQYFPFDSLPQLLNPAGGYVFNTNNSPHSAAAPEDNLDFYGWNKTMGYRLWENNRSLRFQELMTAEDEITWEDFLRIKYDIGYEDSLYLYGITNFKLIAQLDPQKYPDLAPALQYLQAWDMQMDTNNIAASIFLLAGIELVDQLNGRYTLEGKQAKESDCVAALRKAVAHLNKYFGTIEVPLGQLQRHRRGDYSLAVSGGPETLAALYASPDPKLKDGKLYSRVGDSYVELVRFSQEGVEIESVNAYGSSANPDSPHYTDQMQLYVQHKRKVMSLDWEKVKTSAVRIYHPD
ncbi:MAG: penicillin acylase family protein [Bacteroidota bacterium]